MMNKQAFSVGGLLYTPANNPSIARHILNGDWPELTSICLCLEDSIRDSALKGAEEQLIQTLKALACGTPLPMLFIRVRSPSHLEQIHNRLASLEDVLTGYVFPKFDSTNAEGYLGTLSKINVHRDMPLYAMPILESMRVARTDTRSDELVKTREIVDKYRDIVLNMRVGGNDFCNLFGLRRSVHQTIYDLGVVRDILVDIINVFSDEYVISGPVWEYYGSSSEGDWSQGLLRELEMDIANGFIGKTAIHPSQLKVINESLMVSKADYDDAWHILNWSNDTLGVAGSASSGRMNEVKCHSHWAERILLRAQVYGVRKEKADENMV